MATQQKTLDLLQSTCRACGSQVLVARHSHRTVTTLEGVYRRTVKVYQCPNPACPRFHHVCRPEEEGGWALPHGEFGLVHRGRNKPVVTPSTPSKESRCVQESSFGLLVPAHLERPVQRESYQYYLISGWLLPERLTLAGWHRLPSERAPVGHSLCRSPHASLFPLDALVNWNRHK